MTHASSLHNALKKGAHWIFDVEYDDTEDAAKSVIVGSLSAINQFEDTGFTKLLLITDEVVQWYADVTTSEPNLAENLETPTAPAVIRAATGRVWKAISDPNGNAYWMANERLVP